jgi:hypothetical protein
MTLLIFVFGPQAKPSCEWIFKASVNPLISRLSMGGTLLVLDLETKKVASPFKGGEASVFCISLENPGLHLSQNSRLNQSLEHVFVGNCRTGDLKQIDFRAPTAPKSISVVDNTRKS